MLLVEHRERTVGQQPPVALPITKRWRIVIQYAVWPASGLIAAARPVPFLAIRRTLAITSRYDPYVCPRYD